MEIKKAIKFGLPTKKILVVLQEIWTTKKFKKDYQDYQDYLLISPLKLSHIKLYIPKDY